MLARKILVGLTSSSSAAISNQTIQTMGSGTQTALYRLNSSGIVQEVLNGSPNTLETWLLSGTASLYEARATVTVGSLSGGTTGSWLNLGTTRDFWVTETVIEATKSATMTVELRLAANPGTIISTETIELLASVF